MDQWGGLLLLALPVLLLFYLSSRGRRHQRELAGIQARLATGQDVMVGAGMYATVVEVDGDAVVLESSPGVRSRWDRRAVVRIVGQPPGDEPPADGPDTGSEDDRRDETDRTE